MSQCYNNTDNFYCDGYDDLNYLLGFPTDELYVNSKIGTDYEGCGRHNETKCRTLDYAVQQWHNLFHDEIVIDSDGATEDNVLNISFKNVITHPFDIPSKENYPIVKVGSSGFGDSLINMSTGSFRWMGSIICSYLNIVYDDTADTANRYYLCKLDREGSVLNLSDCVVRFHYSSEINLFHNNLLKVESGILCLENVEFLDFQTYDTSLLDLSLQNTCIYSFNNVSFNKTIRSNGNGSIISKKLETVMLLNLSSIIFSNCQCKNGKGGAMYIELSSGSEMDFSGTMFYECLAGGGEGDNYFIVFSELEEAALNLSKWNSILNTTSKLKDAIGVNESGSSDYVPLVTFLWTFPEYLIVKENESIEYGKYCGYVEHPCNSLENGFKRRGSEAKKLAIVGLYNVKSKVEMNDASYHVKGFDEVFSFIFSSDGSFVVVVNL